MSLATCTICGTTTIPQDGRTTQCSQVACLACGAVQCHSRGSARGCCSVCYFGRLPGWSFMNSARTCQYQGCTEPAVYAYLPGSKRNACKAHGDRVLANRAAKREARQEQLGRRYR